MLLGPVLFLMLTQQRALMTSSVVSCGATFLDNGGSEGVDKQKTESYLWALTESYSNSLLYTT